MASAEISGEITRHIEAALVLSQREVLLRLLNEAEAVLKAGQPITTAILAGIVLEEALRLQNLDDCNADHQDRIKSWRQIRKQAAHPGLPAADLSNEQVRAMLTGIRTMLNLLERPQNTSSQPLQFEEVLSKISGKYAFVQTSVDEFLKRKHEDVELEDSK